MSLVSVLFSAVVIVAAAYLSYHLGKKQGIKEQRVRSSKRIKVLNARLGAYMKSMTAISIFVDKFPDVTNETLDKIKAMIQELSAIDESYYELEKNASDEYDFT